ARNAHFGNHAMLEDHHRIFNDAGLVAASLTLAVKMKHNFRDGCSLAAVLHQPWSGRIDAFIASEHIKISATDRCATTITARRRDRHRDPKRVIADFYSAFTFCYFRRGFTLDLGIPGGFKHQVCIKCHKLLLSFLLLLVWLNFYCCWPISRLTPVLLIFYSR